MSHMTDVGGSFQIKNAHKLSIGDLSDLVYYINFTLNDGDYYTAIIPDGQTYSNIEDKFNLSSFIDDDYTCILEASGRNIYETNLKYFSQWMLIALDPDKRTRLEEIFEECITENVTFYFDYEEYDACEEAYEVLDCIAEISFYKVDDIDDPDHTMKYQTKILKYENTVIEKTADDMMSMSYIDEFYSKQDILNGKADELLDLTSKEEREEWVEEFDEMFEQDGREFLIELENNEFYPANRKVT